MNCVIVIQNSLLQTSHGVTNVYDTVIARSKLSLSYGCEMAAVLDYSKQHQRGDATGRAVLEALMDLSAKKDSRFITFAEKLEKLIGTCFIHKGKCRLSTAKDKALKGFNEARKEALAVAWRECITSLGGNLAWSPFLPQCANRRVFNVFLVEHFSSSCTESSVELKMTAEDENALRYICGYVSLKLMRRFQQQTSTRATQFVNCLSGMAVAGRESSFSEYTTEWIHQVDRGGLFHVSEQAYLFFRALELGVWWSVCVCSVCVCVCVWCVWCVCSVCVRVRCVWCVHGVCMYMYLDCSSIQF